MSKTVKRVSKTAKRVTRVMMVGLVAMLAAEAEAHWWMKLGKLYYCNVDCVGKVTGVDITGLNPTPVEAECVVTIPPRKVEVLCSDGAEQRSSAQDTFMLFGQRTIVRDNITITNGVGKDITDEDTTELHTRVSEAPLLVDENGRDKFCLPTPRHPQRRVSEILIRSMSVRYNIYNIKNPDNRLLISQGRFNNCTLPSRFDLDDPPFCGAPINCSDVSFSHDDLDIIKP